MKPLGKAYKDAEATQGGEFKRLPAGGYICIITDVKDCPLGWDPKRPESGDFLRVYFDIAEGEYKDFYADDFGKKYPDIHSYVRSYKEKALGMFKGFLQAVDDSNDTEFVKKAEKDFDEKKLIGKRIGLVLGYEEYESNRGDIRERIYVSANRSVEAIETGDYKVPELRKTKPKNNAVPDGFSALGDDDLPF